MLAQRYGCRLFTCLCYRTAPGRWRLEFGNEIPTHTEGQPRSTEAIAADINRALASADLREKLVAQGLDPRGGSPADFASVIRNDIVKWTKVVADAGIKAD